MNEEEKILYDYPNTKKAEVEGSNAISAFNFFKNINQDQEEGNFRLNAATGVFIPTIQSLWSIVIFVRFYYIVGEAGLGLSLLFASLCLLNAFMTTVSLSAIASSGSTKELTTMEVGGPYYMISRSLGPHLGASLGLVYVLSLLLLASLEISGSIEVFYAATAFEFPGSTHVFIFFIVVVLGSAVHFSTKWLYKIWLATMPVFVVTMLIYITGLFAAPWDTDTEGLEGLSSENMEDNLSEKIEDKVYVGMLFSLFFPAFAAIFTGTHMYSSLKRPSRNIKRGAIAAEVTSYFVYCLILILWSGVAERAYLQNPKRELVEVEDSNQIVKDIGFPHHLVLEIGIMITGISVAFQSYITANRVLKNISKDSEIPELKALGRKWRGVSVRVMLITILVALGVAEIGNVDFISVALTICFLLVYLTINFTSFTMCILSPPTWKLKGLHNTFWKYFYLGCAGGGSLISLGLMFFANYIGAAVGLFVLFGVYSYISYRGVSTNWGSGVQGIKFHLALSQLHSYQKEKIVNTNWRPQLLCYYKISEEADYTPSQLLEFVEQLGKARGLIIVLGILPGDPVHPPPMTTILEKKNQLIEVCKKHPNLKVFPKVVVGENLASSVSLSLMCTGIGGLVPNTVLSELPSSPSFEEIIDFVSLLKSLCVQSKTVVVTKEICLFPANEVQSGYIDIWWIIHDGGLLLYISYLLSQHRMWRNCKKRVFVVGEEIANKEELEKKVASFFTEHLRFNVEIRVLEMEDEAINPYTQDWTYKVRNRRKLEQELDPKKKTFQSVIDQGVYSPESMKRRFTNPEGPKTTAEYDITYNMFSKLNQTIKNYSKDSSLVLITLPEPSKAMEPDQFKAYYDFIYVLSNGLKRVMMLHGTDTDLISPP